MFARETGKVKIAQQFTAGVNAQKNQSVREPDG
jgi:hypothetical protein